jgi:hypothetical protein
MTMAIVMAGVVTCLHAQQGYLGAAFDLMDPMTDAKFGLYMGATAVRGTMWEKA